VRLKLKLHAAEAGGLQAKEEFCKVALQSEQRSNTIAIDERAQIFEAAQVDSNQICAKVDWPTIEFSGG
jgi:hypothetical protein